ncbi:unnamed protein product [Clonostachys rhizophaga]|uniref:Uncharacterized protein n=1 Tax=Clonostachys rhizophaga TaxID=160324 RepID=A0A9N9YUZ7_9HYPO|nr:unnamed protein product [Clonostachys rhizophaga]
MERRLLIVILDFNVSPIHKQQISHQLAPVLGCDQEWRPTATIPQFMTLSVFNNVIDGSMRPKPLSPGVYHQRLADCPNLIRLTRNCISFRWTVEAVRAWCPQKRAA